MSRELSREGGRSSLTRFYASIVTPGHIMVCHALQLGFRRKNPSPYV
jgi:hypothetical protein